MSLGSGRICGNCGLSGAPCFACCCRCTICSGKWGFQLYLCKMVNSLPFGASFDTLINTTKVSHTLAPPDMCAPCVCAGCRKSVLLRLRRPSMPAASWIHQRGPLPWTSATSSRQPRPDNRSQTRPPYQQVQQRPHSPSSHLSAAALLARLLRRNLSGEGVELNWSICHGRDAQHLLNSPTSCDCMFMWDDCA